MDINKITKQKVNIKVFRFNASEDYLPYYDNFTMIVSSQEVVLDILNRIKWEQDGSFSYRRSCRNGICGSCAIKVNGRSTLACKERMEDMIELFGTELVFEPLSTKRAIKDLIIDKGDFWDKHYSVHPYLINAVEEHPENEHIVTPSEVENLLEADICIQCGACFYACPVVDINDNFFGPAAFVKAYRFESDVRDDAHVRRLRELKEPEQGVWDCVKCYECVEVCPKDVNPIEKIIRLRKMLFKEHVLQDNIASKYAVSHKDSIIKYGYVNENQLLLKAKGLGVFKDFPTNFKMFKKGKFIVPWSMPKSNNIDEIRKLITLSSTVEF